MYRLLTAFLTGIIIGCSSPQKKSFAPIDTGIEKSNSNLAAPKTPAIDSSLLVLDTTIKLCWMKHDFSYIKKRFLNNWNEIFEWQKELNSKNYAGFNDWNIPTISQYRTLNNTKEDRIIYKKTFVELDTICVWGKGAYSFWSSTTPNKNTASYISFIDGFATSGDRSKQFSSPYSSWKGVELGMSVRLVRIMK
jgi:Protein of unknown function (DUF1566)